MGLRFLKNRTASKIESVGKEIQSLIDVEIKNSNFEIENNSPFNQAGMLDGLHVVNEYNSVGEYGLAFEHVLYMIHETGLKLNKQSSDIINDLAREMNISIDHIENQLIK